MERDGFYGVGQININNDGGVDLLRRREEQNAEMSLLGRVGRGIRNWFWPQGIANRVPRVIATIMEAVGVAYIIVGATSGDAASAATLCTEGGVVLGVGTIIEGARAAVACKYRAGADNDENAAVARDNDRGLVRVREAFQGQGQGVDPEAAEEGRVPEVAAVDPEAGPKIHRDRASSEGSMVADAPIAPFSPTTIGVAVNPLDGVIGGEPEGKSGEDDRRDHSDSRRAGAALVRPAPVSQRRSSSSASDVSEMDATVRQMFSPESPRAK